MPWFNDLLSRVAGEQAEDLLFADGLNLHSEPVTAQAADTLIPNECYVELYIESLRIEKARTFATRFHGVVYSFVTISRQGESTPVIAAVTKPAKLADLDATSMGKVITVSHKMMGPIAWRGGDFAIELGLFSVKSGNLMTPIINFVTKVSDTAGVSFVGAAKPFLPLITEGMDLIAGQTADVRLEVGVDTVMQVNKPKFCAIVAAPRDALDTRTLSIDPMDRKLLSKGQPVQYGYCVFSIRGTDRKADYGDIPELHSSFAALREGIITGKQETTREALAVFRRTAFVSPDLIPSDAARLVESAEKMVSDALAPSSSERFAGQESGTTAPVSPPAELKDLPLYERES
jgi:hypothetical protein